MAVFGAPVLRSAQAVNHRRHDIGGGCPSSPGLGQSRDKISTSYSGKRRSTVMSVNPSVGACAMSIRSNGSLWCSGRAPAARAWATVIDNESKDRLRPRRGRSSGASRRPAARLMAISQAVADQTGTPSTSGSAMVCARAGGRLGSSASHHSKMGCQEEPSPLVAPKSISDAFRARYIEIGSKTKFARTNSPVSETFGVKRAHSGRPLVLPRDLDLRGFSGLDGSDKLLTDSSSLRAC